MVLVFSLFGRGCAVCVGARGGGARGGGQAWSLPVTLPEGAVEARRSRVPREWHRVSDAGGALELGGTAPQAARCHRGLPRTPQSALFGAGKGVGVLLGSGREWSNGVLQVGFPGWTGRWGLSVIPSLRKAAWSAATGAVGRGQSDEATRHRVGVMTSTTRVRPQVVGDHALRWFRQRMCPSRSP